MNLGHFIGIGSNVGAKVHVAQAIRALLSLSPELALSRVIGTQPKGMVSELSFLNAVAYLRTDLAGGELKGQLNMIEGRLGRDRSDPDRGRKDRCIDLDVLLSVHHGPTEIKNTQVSDETYYRPQMIELIHLLGFACDIPAEPMGYPVAIEFEGRLIGTRPVWFGNCGGLMQAADSCEQ
jgi:2-amino-4-hydroxy-6-hydroxymethyldihydropteridine diphosphokinase